VAITQLAPYLRGAFLFSSVFGLALRLVPAEDPALVGRVRLGDAAAFRILFDRYHAVLLFYAERHGISPEDAEDIVQAAFVYVWQHRERLDPEKSFRAYLYRIVHSRMLNHIRDGWKRDPLPEEWPAPVVHEASSADLGQQIQEALARLPAGRRQVFTLVVLEGLKQREAAEVLGISPRTVENQLSAAVKTLRGLLAPIYKEWRGE